MTSEYVPDNVLDRIARLEKEVEKLETDLNRLLVLIIDEDAVYFEGGAQKLDEAAFDIARRMANPDQRLQVYLDYMPDYGQGSPADGTD